MDTWKRKINSIFSCNLPNFGFNDPQYGPWIDTPLILDLHDVNLQSAILGIVMIGVPLIDEIVARETNEIPLLDQLMTFFQEKCRMPSKWFNTKDSTINETQQNAEPCQKLKKKSKSRRTSIRQNSNGGEKIKFIFKNHWDTSAESIHFVDFNNVPKTENLNDAILNSGSVNRTLKGLDIRKNRDLLCRATSKENENIVSEKLEDILNNSRNTYSEKVVQSINYEKNSSTSNKGDNTKTITNEPVTLTTTSPNDEPPPSVSCLQSFTNLFKKLVPTKNNSRVNAMSITPIRTANDSTKELQKTRERQIMDDSKCKKEDEIMAKIDTKKNIIQYLTHVKSYTPIELSLSKTNTNNQPATTLQSNKSEVGQNKNDVYREEEQTDSKNNNRIGAIEKQKNAFKQLKNTLTEIKSVTPINLTLTNDQFSNKHAEKSQNHRNKNMRSCQKPQRRDKVTATELKNNVKNNEGDNLDLIPECIKNIKVHCHGDANLESLINVRKSDQNKNLTKEVKVTNSNPRNINEIEVNGRLNEHEGSGDVKEMEKVPMMKADDHFIAKPEEGKEGHFQSSANDYIHPLTFNARCFLSAPEPTVDERTLQDQYIHIRQNLETKSREFQHLYENYQNLKKKMPVNISNKNVCNDFCSATKDTTPQSFGASTNRSTHQTNDSILRFNIQEKSDSTAESVVKTMFDESSDERITFDKVIMELQARMTEDMAIIADPSDYQLNVMELFTNLRTIDETGESQTSLVSMALREMRSLQNRGCDDTISQCTIRDSCSNIPQRLESTLENQCASIPSHKYIADIPSQQRKIKTSREKKSHFTEKSSNFHPKNKYNINYSMTNSHLSPSKNTNASIPNNTFNKTPYRNDQSKQAINKQQLNHFNRRKCLGKNILQQYRSSQKTNCEKITSSKYDQELLGKKYQTPKNYPSVALCKRLKKCRRRGRNLYRYEDIHRYSYEDHEVIISYNRRKKLGPRMRLANHTSRLKPNLRTRGSCESNSTKDSSEQSDDGSSTF
ncbi:hypothetical protein M8J76_009744 [Diaphorina citri]|nr:hypothetical protein M8J76_009744 [Diaphorina citri]